MNIVVLNRSDWLDERRVRLVDRRADHIRSVLRAAVGDSIRVGSDFLKEIADDRAASVPWMQML